MQTRRRGFLVLLTSFLALATAKPVSDRDVHRNHVEVFGKVGVAIADMNLRDAISPLVHAFEPRASSYIVKSGDTGSAIAASAGFSFDQLSSLNPNVQWNNLQIGQSLNMPVSGSVMTTSAASPTYVVVAGDTGYTIAAKNNITFQQLAQANPGVKWTNLQVGQKLTLVSHAGSQLPPPPAGPAIGPNNLSPPPANQVPGPNNLPPASPLPTSSFAPVPQNPNPVITTKPSITPSAVLSAVSSVLPGPPQASAKYTVKSGDTGYAIAQALGITFEALSAANPGVTWTNLQIGQTLNLPAGTNVTPSLSASISLPTVLSTTPVQTVSPAASSPVSSSLLRLSAPVAVVKIDDISGASMNGAFQYQTYSGDGSNFPKMQDWLSFNALWTGNQQYIGQNCVVKGSSYATNTVNETNAVRAAIQQVATDSGVDHRLIFVVMMQESNGCVRVPTTSSESISNPGLMQSFNGLATCNPGNGIAPTTPCPSDTILRMVQEGVQGATVGVVQAIKAAMATSNAGTAGANGAISANDLAILYYKAMRTYNSGSIPADGDLSGPSQATRCYVSDIANRLRGWNRVNSPTTCF